jgi:CDP-glucose 4,6-dehydratase
LITGVTGFVGSSLASRLVNLGARVVGLVRDETPESYFNLLGLEKSVTVVHGSLEEYPLLERTVNEYGVGVVYHLGAQTIVGTANRSPLSTFKANIEGTWNLLEACRGKDHVRAVVVASSDKAYGSHKELPYREDFPLNPEYPYDVSKACADLLARSFCKTYGLPVVITRFANIYGPGDLNFSRIIPDTIRSVLEGKNPVVRSDGTPERDYLYIDDVADLYLLLAERIGEAKGEVFNAGHNKPVRVLEVVELILRLAGRTDLRPDIRGKGSPHGEIDRQWLDGGKAKRRLGWEPKIGLEEGLRRTIEWYRGCLKREE